MGPCSHALSSLCKKQSRAPEGAPWFKVACLRASYFLDAGFFGHHLEALALAGVLAFAAVHGSLALAMTLAGIGAITFHLHIFGACRADRGRCGEQGGGSGCECCGNQFAI